MEEVEDVLEGQLRVAVTTATQMAQSILRAREEARREAAVRTAEEARRLEARFEAERRTAEVALRDIRTREWWDRATPEQIGHALDTAMAWAPESAEARATVQRIQEEMQNRYGIDVFHPEQSSTKRNNADLAKQTVLAAAATAAEVPSLDDLAADVQHTMAVEDLAESQRLREVVVDEQKDGNTEAAQDAAEDSEIAYDSAERREGYAADLTARGIDDDLVTSRIAADVAQARPATEAVTGGRRAGLKTSKVGQVTRAKKRERRR